jgi:hypothetical protein
MYIYRERARASERARERERERERGKERKWRERQRDRAREGERKNEVNLLHRLLLKHVMLQLRDGGAALKLLVYAALSY